MEVVKITPRGYCHGVVNAVNQLRHILTDKTVEHPVYILGKVVHNQKIVDDFERLGLITLHEEGKSRLELLDKIKTGTVVFTAHGVSDAVYKKAKAKNLAIIDTTCKDVFQSQNTIKTYINDGYNVIFIGKKGHPEVETALAYENVYLITSLKDVDALNITNNTPLAVTNQTTMSLFDIYHITEAIQQKYPHANIIDEICAATKMRQIAVKNQPKDVEFCFVVGDKYSNNSNKLKTVSLQNKIPATLIQSIEDIDPNAIKNFKKVSVTSGASTPTQLTNEVIQYLINYDKNSSDTAPLKSKVLQQNIFK